MPTTEQIEVRALAVFNERRGNLARRDKWASELMRYEGKEREFCLGVAESRIAQDAYAARMGDAEIAYWASASDAALRAMASEITEQQNVPLYNIANSTESKDRDRSELYRINAELARRAALAPVAANINAFCETLMARHVRVADLSPAVEAV